MNSVFDTVMNFIKDNDTVIRIGAGIIVFLLFLVLRKKLSQAILNLIGAIAFRKNEHHKETFISALVKPLSFYFIILGAFIALYINIQSAVILRTFKIATILVISWAIVSYLSDNLYILFKFGNSTDDKLNATVLSRNI